jgi:hypothetical protein
MDVVATDTAMDVVGMVAATAEDLPAAVSMAAAVASMAVAVASMAVAVASMAVAAVDSTVVVATAAADTGNIFRS